MTFFMGGEVFNSLAKAEGSENTSIFWLLNETNSIEFVQSISFQISN